MATIIIGSARHDENGKYSGGTKGDQLQKSSTNDTVGEVSMQNFYVHSKGWYILRPVSADVATKLAAAMKTACNNANIGYSQSDRTGVITAGITTKTKTNTDCSALVRACIKYVTGKDVGNFTTANEVTALVNSKLFTKVGAFTSQSKTPVYDGDVLVTKTKGHTAIVVSGNSRSGASTSTSASVSSGSYKYNNVDYSKVFNPTYYANNNADVKAAFGTDATKLFNHFCTYGMKEARQAIASFNVKVYKANNADIVKALGSNANNWAEYYKHYCVYGYKENRKCI